MIKIMEMSLYNLILALFLILFFYHLAEVYNTRFFNLLKLKNQSLRLLLAKVILTGFNILIINIVGLNLSTSLHIQHLPTGLFWIGVGVCFSLLIARLTFQMVRDQGYGEQFTQILTQSPGLSALTMLIFVGPAEDLLFLGVFQYIFMDKMGWVAVPAYMLLFSFYHYLNVLDGTEKQREFWGMLPVRLVISFILSMAYYQTGSLMYSMIIHNLFDFITYLGLLKGAQNKMDQ